MSVNAINIKKNIFFYDSETRLFGLQARGAPLGADSEFLPTESTLHRTLLLYKTGMTNGVGKIVRLPSHNLRNRLTVNTPRPNPHSICTEIG